MDVSVIIVNYNTSNLVLDCIDTIKNQTNGVEYEVIVVDNASKCDNNLSLLKCQEDITYVQSESNLGFGRANNLGLQYATGNYIFFLNSDTLLLNNAIKIMYDFAENYEGRLGAIGTILEDRKSNAIHSYGKFPEIKDSLFKLILGPVKKILSKNSLQMKEITSDYMRVDYVTGADLFVKRSVLSECKPFNPSFFMYYEETEMEHRFMLAGYDNLVIRTPRIIHLEGESSSGSGKSRFLRDTVRQQRSEFIYYKLTEPLWKYYMYRIFLPLFRQITWLNPKVSFKDKLTYMKTLFQTIQIIEF